MIFKVSYTIDSEDCGKRFFQDRKKAKEDFLNRYHELGVNNTWKVSNLKRSLEYWNTMDLSVGNRTFWVVVGVKVEKIKTSD